MYYIYMIATNASCAIVIEDQADQASSANGFTCNGVPKIVSDYRFLLQTAVTVCGNLIGNKTALCSTCVSALTYMIRHTDFELGQLQNNNYMHSRIQSQQTATHCSNRLLLPQPPSSSTSLVHSVPAEEVEQEPEHSDNHRCPS